MAARTSTSKNSDHHSSDDLISDDDQSSSEPNEQLMRAIVDGDLITVKLLMEVWYVDPHSNTTPLHLASEYGHLDVVRYLVEETNYDVECRDEDEETPLHVAAREGRLDIVQYLIGERGCDPMCKGQGGGTSLH